MDKKYDYTEQISESLLFLIFHFYAGIINVCGTPSWLSIQMLINRRIQECIDNKSLSSRFIPL